MSACISTSSTNMIIVPSNIVLIRANKAENKTIYKKESHVTSITLNRDKTVQELFGGSRKLNRVNTA